jgi:hypothetical protein
VCKGDVWYAPIPFTWIDPSDVLESGAIRRRKETDRWEKAMSHKTHMNGGRKSHSGVVRTNRSNGSHGVPKEIVEGRPLWFGDISGTAQRGTTEGVSARSAAHVDVATAAEESTKPLELGALSGETRTLDPGSPDPAFVSGGALGVQTSKIRTVCVRSVRTDPCGGCRVTGIPTATGRLGAPWARPTAANFRHCLRLAAMQGRLLGVPWVRPIGNRPAASRSQDPRPTDLLCGLPLCGAG